MPRPGFLILIFTFPVVGTLSIAVPNPSKDLVGLSNTNRRRPVSAAKHRTITTKSLGKNTANPILPFSPSLRRLIGKGLLHNKNHHHQHLHRTKNPKLFRVAKQPESREENQSLNVEQDNDVTAVAAGTTGSINEHTATEKRKKKRWQRNGEISRPFVRYENFKSTFLKCLLAIGAYITLGTLAFPLLFEPSWTYIDSLYFSMTTLTTTGYGDLVPTCATIPSRIFTMMFALLGISIDVAAVSVIGQNIIQHQQKAITKTKESLKMKVMKMYGNDGNEEAEVDTEERIIGNSKNNDIGNLQLEDNFLDERKYLLETIQSAIMWQLPNMTLLAFLAFLIKQYEGWTFVQTSYFWVESATTVGFGDVVPKTQMARLIAVFFLPLAVVSTGDILGRTAGYLIRRATARADKYFMRRQVTDYCLEQMDVDQDGKVNKLDFISFMLVQMEKVDKETLVDLKRLFNALDAGKDGYIQKEDLLLLAKRKRKAREMRTKTAS